MEGVFEYFFYIASNGITKLNKNTEHSKLTRITSSISSKRNKLEGSVRDMLKILTACFTVRGKPSRINPDSPWSSPFLSLFDKRLKIISSETNFP